MHERLKIPITTSVSPTTIPQQDTKKSQSPLSSGIFRPQVGVLLAEKERNLSVSRVLSFARGYGLYGLWKTFFKVRNWGRFGFVI